MTRVLWITQRSERHQQAALRAAPPFLDVTMLHDPTPAKLKSALGKAEILVSERSGTLTADLLDNAPSLRMILRLGSLVHDIDLDACKLRQIVVCRQPVMISQLVAEHLLMMILALLKRLNAAQVSMTNLAVDAVPRRTDENTFSYNWNKLENIDGLIGKQLVILGMGEIGVELARRLYAFQPATIYYHKRTPYPPAIEAELSLHYADPLTCYSRAHIVVALLPYSRETDLMLNKAVFERMKRGALLVHAGSGSTINEGELAQALQAGHLGGAALDTFEYEPLPLDNPLVALTRDPKHNLILTPHVGSGTGKPDRRHDFAEIERFLAGKQLSYQVV